MPEYELRYGKERIKKFRDATDPGDEDALRSLLRRQVEGSGRILDRHPPFLRFWIKGKKIDFYLS